jgi:predicted transcriptional regulator
LATEQSPIKVSAATKERVRYLAALSDATQAEIVDRAVEEYAARHVEEIKQGIQRARFVLTGGDAEIAAYLLDLPVEDVKRVTGPRPTANADPS